MLKGLVEKELISMANFAYFQNKVGDIYVLTPRSMIKRQR